MAGPVRALRAAVEAAGLSGLLLDAACGTIMAGILLMAMPAAGFLMDRALHYIHRFLSHVFGPRAAFFVMNYATFPGVMAHELSHALIARLSGCRVDEVRLFEPKGDTLGYVKFTCTGPKRRQWSQMSASACAPVLCGAVLSPLLMRAGLYFEGHALLQAMLYHFGVSVAAHMTMSRQDLKNYFRGAAGMLLRLAPIGLVLSYLLGRA